MPSIPFRRVAIVGVGLIGGSIGLAMRRRMRGTHVIGVDSPAVIRRARSRGAIHEGTVSLERGLRHVDLVVMALPVEGILRLLPRVARLAPSSALITDVGSTKGTILRAAVKSGLRDRFVGGHPMAGSERSGVKHADPALFRGAAWILCPGGGGSGSTRVEAWVRRVGGRPVVLDAQRHDDIVARLSHVPQLLSIALVNSAVRGARGKTLRLAGPAFRQMSRLAGSSPVLWNGILRTNRRAIARALDDFTRELRMIRSGLGHGAGPTFRRARRATRALPALRTDR